MTDDHAGMPRIADRFLGSWKRALGELAIVALGVLLALWADQAIQSRQEAARAIGYLERLQEDVRADIRSLQFSRDQARNRLAITRQIDAWLHDPNAAPDPDALVMNAHFAGVLFPPTISKFTIDELKSKGDLRLLKNQALKRSAGLPVTPKHRELRRRSEPRVPTPIGSSNGCAPALTSKGISATACTGHSFRPSWSTA